MEKEIEAAKALIAKQNEQDIQDCIKELNEAETAILTKYGCVKGIVMTGINGAAKWQITIQKG